MKMSGLFAACVMAVLPLATLGQDGSRASAPHGIEIAELVAKYAKSAGKPFVVDPRVRANGREAR